VTKTYLKYRRRITVLSGIMIIAWAGLTFRLFEIQVIKGEKYRSQGIKQGQAREPLLAVRGNIYDRNDIPLTRNIIRYNIGVHPAEVEDKARLAAALSSCTGRSEDYYLKRLNSKKSFIYLERNLRKETFNALPYEVRQQFIIERHSRRYYPHANLTGQVIGFTDVDDQGLAGIEKRFDPYLRGKPGWVVKQRSGQGDIRPKSNFPYQPPEDGANIQLTLDLDYQSILREELYRRIEETQARSATGLLMNPQDGSILAMASVPDFDPNRPGQFATEYQKIKAITDQFEPGSTFKIVPVTAALSLGTVSPAQEFNCEYGSYRYKDIRINDHEEYGLLTVGQVIQHSSNVGVIKIAETVGEDNLYRFARDYGFGMPTQINLIGEVGGTLRRVSEWSDISLAEIAMGQEVGVTALQLAAAYAAIANGGFLVKPRLVKQVVTPEGRTIYTEQPEVVRKVASREVMNTIKEMLVSVVESGTGTAAHIPGWSIAGKTGTAQKFIDGEYSRTKFVSNFVGFFPAEDPVLLGAFLLDEPRYGYHWGGVGAAPLFKRVMERIINMDDSIRIPSPRSEPRPEPVLVANPVQPIAQLLPSVPVPLQTTGIFLSTVDSPQSVVVPEVRGMSLRKAITVLRQRKLRTKINGSGRVIWQSPPPGTKVSRGSICEIGLQ
jgi:cell division protein FtsI/penicillin-binding protein 2